MSDNTEKGLRAMGKQIATWITGSCGYHLSSPGSAYYDHYFCTKEQMWQFAEAMGWKLRRA